MKNANRILVDSIRRYCAVRGLAFASFSDDWILKIGKGARSHLVFGYDLGANTSSAARTANDKSATYQVLTAAGVDAVEHRVFLHPRYLDFVATDGNWPGLLQAFADFGGDVVVKDNEGTGGMEVFRARSQRELEQRVHQLMLISRGIAVAPYLHLAREMRFVVLDGEALLTYTKERQSVTGDGKRTVRALIAEALLAGRITRGIGDYDNPDRPLDSVPGPGTTVPLQWRHNLGLGARPGIVDVDAKEHAEALELARRAMAALGLTFGSVDVVTTPEGLRVMEVNAGVMLEVAASGETGAELADRIYHRVLDRILA
jgi:glutathione synthase/RimK-type ligase-like ATP-grasp enzyme